ncbi:MAG TPA: hypothetical protein VH352_02765 [Pseudonocardiaceae bacterium]|nr:hypothetical protein [Pseudonocardiaceae bacterium]
MNEARQFPVPGKVIHGDLAQIVGRPWTQAFFWLVVLTAGGVDIATFYQVLVLVLDAPESLVWIAVVGFVAVGLTLAHYTGLQIRQAVSPRHVTGSVMLAWVFGGVWLLLGVVAFAVRYVITQPLGSNTSTFVVDGATQTPASSLDTTPQHATALLFLVFYIATGTVTALAGGYFRQDPNARQFGRAVERRTTAVRRHARSLKRYGRVIEVAQTLADARARRETAWTTALAQCEAAAQLLKRETRLRIAGNGSPTTPTAETAGAAPPTRPAAPTPAQGNGQPPTDQQSTQPAGATPPTQPATPTPAQGNGQPPTDQQSTRPIGAAPTVAAGVPQSDNEETSS